MVIMKYEIKYKMSCSSCVGVRKQEGWAAEGFVETAPWVLVGLEL